jgi:uncharacterized membrane protein
MNEDQADEIITKLDDLALNTMTRDQGKEILEKLKDISTELEQFRVEFEKMSDD